MSTLYNQVVKANIYVQPVLFTLIVVTNILKIWVLCSRTLRTSPCTYYFIAYAIFSIIYNCILCPTQVVRALLIGWENTLVGCKIYFYVLFTAPFLAQVMLILASFDRYCSSAKSRQLNSTSTIRTARLAITITTISSIVYMSPMIIIFYFDTATGICQQYTNLPTNIYVFSQLILYYILSPLLMITFGILTIINIRQHAIRTIPHNHLTRGSRGKEGQLTRMLLLQIFTHLILSIPFGVMYSMNTFSPSSRTLNIFAIRYILNLIFQCDFFLSFFLYIVSGSIYRERLRELFKFTNKRARAIHAIHHQQNATIRPDQTINNTMGV